jgi:hypothetical protein
MLNGLAFSGGCTSPVGITSVEIIRSQGFQIIGNFGNP